MSHIKNMREIEKEIEDTTERLRKILGPFYELDIEDIVKMKGKDLLFYGYCCKLEGGLEKYLKALKETKKRLLKKGRLVHDKVAEEIKDVEEAIKLGEEEK